MSLYVMRVWVGFESGVEHGHLGGIFHNEIDALRWLRAEAKEQEKRMTDMQEYVRDQQERALRIVRGELDESDENIRTRLALFWKEHTEEEVLEHFKNDSDIWRVEWRDRHHFIVSGDDHYRIYEVEIQ